MSDIIDTDYLEQNDYTKLDWLIRDVADRIHGAFIESFNDQVYREFVPDRLIEAQQAGLTEALISDSVEISNIIDELEPTDDTSSAIRSVEDVLGQEINSIESELNNFGWEAIAWYRPFHFGLQNWGVYIREDRFLAYVIKCVRQTSQSWTVQDFCEIYNGLWQSILWHEYFHFHVEIFGLKLEDRCNHPAYLPYSAAIYTKTWGTSNCVEEALATANEIRKTPPSFKSYVINQSDGCPPGYADYHLYMPPNFIAGKDKLCGQISETDLRGEARPYRFPSDTGAASTDFVPIHLISLPKLKPGPGNFFYLETIGNKSLIKFVERNGGQIRRGGKHPLVINIQGRSIPLKTNWRDNRVPGFVIKEVADLFGMRPRALVDAARKL